MKREHKAGKQGEWYQDDSTISNHKKMNNEF